MTAIELDSQELQKSLEVINSRIYEETALADKDEDYLYSEDVFTKLVIETLQDIGITGDSAVQCRFMGKVNRQSTKLSGYCFKELDWGGSGLDLFVTYFQDSQEPFSVSSDVIKKIAGQCLKFVKSSYDGKILGILSPSDEELRELAALISNSFTAIDKVNIYVLTNGCSSSTDFKDDEYLGKDIGVQVFDLRRISRILLEGVKAEPVNINLEDENYSLPCLVRETEKYEWVLTALPGELIYSIYRHWGSRLLEANVRAWLTTGRSKKSVNKGIQDSILNTPDMFFAYNNGLVITASNIEIGRNSSGAYIKSLEDVQIVNGGQTCATMYFTKRKNKAASLDEIFVPAKILIKKDIAEATDFVANVSKFANKQNAIKESDLTSNIPFLVELERVSQTVWAPSFDSKWFFERANGSFKTELERYGVTKARRASWLKTYPSKQKIKKTELAKYLSCWFCMPDKASLGDQKNYGQFIDKYIIDNKDITISSDDWKRMVAVSIIFKNIHKRCQTIFSAFKINMANYAVAILALNLSKKINLMYVWNHQGISGGLLAQAETWIKEAQPVMERESNGRMLSEFCKKSECWDAVKQINFSECNPDIPELKNPDTPFLTLSENGTMG